MAEDAQSEFKDKALFDQLEALKNKQVKESAAKVKSPGAQKMASNDSEISFQDEPPFSQELPF